MDKKLIIYNLSFIIRKSRGFTLIELLIVMGIIGILAAFLMANFVGVRQRARDGVRKSDLRQIQSALELYRSDSGSYPGSVPNSTIAACSTSLLSDPADCNSTVYMKKVPVDPSSGIAYSYSSPSSTTYSIIACLENGNDSQKDTTNVAPCNGTTNFSYTLQNP